MTRDLSDSIDGLYSVFARYIKPATLPACPCCALPSDGQALLVDSLREIPADRISTYAELAMLTWGGVDDFRYFLPRVFQVAVIGDLDLVSLEVIFGKLRLGNWLTWPKDEQLALRSFMCAFWNDLLANYPSVWDSDTGLCALAHANESVEPFLGQWTDKLGGCAALHFRDFVRGNVGSALLKHNLGKGFWRERQIQMSQVVSWLLSPQLAADIRTSFELADDETILGALIEALDYLPPTMV